MSQQNFQAPKPVSTWQPTQTSDNFEPPAKRQRLSPSPVSPYTQSPQLPYGNSQAYSNITLPNGAFNNTRRPSNGTMQTFQQNDQQLTPGSMGPPQRPVERADPAQKPADRPERDRPFDINQISDSVLSSGIDIREEEENLYSTYRSDRNNISFKTESSQTISPQNSFDLLSQNNFGSLGSSHGSLQQQPSKQSQEEELFEKHKKAARAVSESQQNHLEDPFLWGASVRKAMEKAANDNGVRIPMEGLWDRMADKPESISGTSITHSDGGAIRQVKAPSLLTRGVPMESILCLLSLATNERIRGLLEDAYGLARGRRLGADGVVPPEFSDLVADSNAQPTTVKPASASGAAWESTQAASNALPSPPDSAESPKAKPIDGVPSVALPKDNSLTKALAEMSQRDRAAEEARLKARAARRAKKASQAAQAATSAGATPESGTPGPSSASDKPPATAVSEKAPEPKLTKKEREKAAKQGWSEDVATKNANLTASMQLGGKQYSWMTKAKPAAPSQRPSLGPSVTKPATSSSGGDSSQTKDGLEHIKDRKFGEWREDGIGGHGVQIRDWVAVLEMDGREQRTLSRAYAKLGSEKVAGAEEVQQSE